MGLNHPVFNPYVFAYGGAGNRTQIETDQYEIPEGKPQRHVLPLLGGIRKMLFVCDWEEEELTTTPPLLIRCMLYIY